MTVDQGHPWNIHMGDIYGADWTRINKSVLIISTAKTCKENPTKYEVVPLRGTDFNSDAEKQVLAETTITS